MRLGGGIAVILAALLSGGSVAAQDSPSQNQPLDQAAARWVCSESRRSVCTASGCNELAPSVQITLLFDSDTYLRCQADECERHAIDWRASSGLFTTLFADSGILLKVVNDGSAYSEIVLLGLTSTVGHGTCAPAS